MVPLGPQKLSRETEKFGVTREVIETLCGKGRKRKTPRAVALGALRQPDGGNRS